MPKVSPIQHSYNAGEVTPLLYARSDLAKYKNGLKVSKNGLPLVQGAWTRRPGTYYVAPTKENGVARLLRFEFSTTQAYIIELGDLYARFYKDHGAILESATPAITGATRANPVVVTAVAHGFLDGEEVEITGVLGMTQINGRRFRVINPTLNTFQLYGVEGGFASVNGTAYTAYSGGGTAARVYTLTTTYSRPDIPALKYAQSADTLYIAHQSYPPRKMTRTAHASWTINTIDFLDGPYLPTNATAVTFLLGAVTGATTITASAPTFVLTDVGRLVRWKDPASHWTWLKITGFTSTTIVAATVMGPDASAVTATTNWRLGAWSDTTGYPGAVCFDEDRLWFGGPTSYPQRMDGSNSSDYENFAPSAVDGVVGDANAISVTLNASDVNVIRWIQDDEKGLLVGTVGGEWIVRGATPSEAISPTNIAAKRSTTYGSANVQPVKAGKATLYLQRSSRKLRELAYVYEVDGFRAPDMTVLSEHITTGGISAIAYQQETQPIVWGVRGDGTLVGFTYNRDQEVLAWHRHTLGGRYSTGSSALNLSAKVESVATVPAPGGTRDEAWVIVNRYINGAQRRYVEYLTKAWERGDAQADAVCVDSALSLNNVIGTGGGAFTLTPGTGATVEGTTGVIFTVGGAMFAITDIGRYIHYDYDQEDADGVLLKKRAAAVITGYTDTTHVTATVIKPWPSTDLIDSAGWRMSVTTITGLWHLEGQSVSLWMDGAVQPAKTVVNGGTTLTYPASKGAGGLAYNSDLQTLRVDAGAADGTAQGKIQRFNRMAFHFHDTLGAKVGPSFDKLTPIVFRESSADASVAVPLFSGYKVVTWDGDYSRESYVCVRQDLPAPFTLLGHMPQLNTQDG